MTAPARRKIAEPGLYTDVSAAEYHADPCIKPSLSSSIAKILIDDASSPAHARLAHPRFNPEAAQDDGDRKMEIGTVAHKIALGRGREVAIIDAATYQTKAAKEERAAAREAGHAPILAPDLARAEKAAASLRDAFGQIPELGFAFEPECGLSEPVAVWREGPVWCRAMLDRLRIASDRAVLVDLKFTADSAAQPIVSRRLYQMGYDLSAGFYRRGLAFVKPEVREFVFLLATVETQPPFAWSVVTIDGPAWALAEKRIRKALALWERCLRTGVWPGYPAAVGIAEMPAWLESNWLEREANDATLRELGFDYATLSDIHQVHGPEIAGPV